MAAATVTNHHHIQQESESVSIELTTAASSDSSALAIKSDKKCMQKKRTYVIIGTFTILLLLCIFFVEWFLWGNPSLFGEKGNGNGNGDYNKQAGAPRAGTTYEAAQESIVASNNPKKCVDLITKYLDRINTYDAAQGINSILSLNPNVLTEAQALDDYYDTHNEFVGRLHCVPLLVKDMIDIKDTMTTGGLDLFHNDSWISVANADIMQSLFDAGAIWIAKTNLKTLGFSLTHCESEVAGSTFNPYSSNNRTPYASSGGTGAAVAAEFGVIGIGTDTGGSVIYPSTGNGIFGIRPPNEIMSSQMNGVQPINQWFDTVGPMTKSCLDGILVMDVLLNGTAHEINYDDIVSLKDYKAINFGHITDFYTTDGFPTQIFNTSDEIMDIQDKILHLFDSKGVDLNATQIAEFQAEFYANSWGARLGCRAACYDNAWDDYLSFHGGYTTVQDLVDNPPANAQTTFINRLNDSLPLDCNTVCGMAAQRQVVRDWIDAIFDVLIFPGTPIKPQKVDDISIIDFATFSKYLGLGPSFFPFIDYPTINIPAGFTAPIANDAPLGLPQGMFLISKTEDFDTLLTACYGYEKLYYKPTLPESVA